jgi:chitodextrinase
MALRPGQHLYQSGVFEAIGLLGQLLVALPNLDLFAGPATVWLRVVGLAMATLHVCVLMVRSFLPDHMLEASADAQGAVAGFRMRLQAGNRRVVVPVTLIAVIVAGFSLYGAQVLGLNGDASTPSAPGNLRSTGATAQQIDLAWDAVLDDRSGVREYRVVRQDNGLARTSPSTAFHDTLGISGGVTYEYTVVAVDGAGNMSQPSAVAVTTPVSDPAACRVDTTPPAPPGNVRAAIVTPTSVTLEWDPTTDVGACGLAGYRVIRDGQDTGIIAAGTTVTEEGLEPDHSYVYTVLGRDNANNESALSGATTVRTLARPVQSHGPCELIAPRGLYNTGHTTTSVSMAWSAPMNGCGIVGYRIYRGATLVGQTTGFTFTVYGLSAATGYVFTVRSYNGAGDTSPSSNLLSVTTAPPTPTPPVAPDITPPTAPTSLNLVSRTSTSLVIGWSPSTDTQSGVMMYLIVVDRLPSGPGVSAPPTATPGTTLAGLSPLTSYRVRVAALDNAGNQSGTVEAVFATAPVPGGITLAAAPAQLDAGASVTITVDNFEVSGLVNIFIDGNAVGSFTAAQAPASYVLAGSLTAGLSPGPHVITVVLAECACGGDGDAMATITINPGPSPSPSP